MQEQIIPTNPEDAEAMVPVIPEVDVIQGINATIQIGETTTLTPGSDATVENVGSDTHAVLNFGIPEGERGETGPRGPQGETGDSATIQMSATATTLSAGSQATATITNSGDSHNANYTLALGIPQGIQGERGVQGIQGERGPQGIQGIQGVQGVQGVPGKDFSIYKTYASIAEMNADAANVPEGDFVMIASTTQDPDNAKLYVKNGEGTFTYLSDLSGAQGIQGPQGVQGIQGIQGIPGPQGETGPRGSVKSQYVAELPATGDEDTFYLVDRDLESHTESGEYITLETTQTAAAIQSAQIYGNAEQTTYSGKNLFNVNRTLGVPSDTNYVNTTKRTFNFDEYVVGITRNNYYSQAAIASYSVANGIVKVTPSQGYYGIGFPVSVLPSTTYTISATLSASGEVYTGYYASDGTYIDNTTQKTFTTPSSCSFIVMVVMSITANVEATVSNIQLELGSTATAYEPYVGGTASPNPDYPQPISTVTGEQNIKVVGKNLFDKDDVSVINAYIRLNGGLAASGPDRTVLIPIQPNATYTVSAQRIGQVAGQTNDDFWGTLISSDTTPAVGSEGTIVFSSIQGDLNRTFTTDSTQNWLALKVANVNRSDYDGTLATVQLELGSTATAYEPYQGQEYEVNLGKNLLPNNMTSQTLNGVTFTVNADKSITMSGTATARSEPRIYYVGASDSVLKLKAGTTYYNNMQTTIYLYTATYRVIYAGASYTPTADETVTQAYIRVENGETVDTTIYPMLTAGAPSATYAPYFTPIELAKIGTYQDRIYKNDGKWYIEKQVGKVVLNGTEAGWGIFNNNNAFYSGAYDAQKPSSTTTAGAIMANYYTAESEVNIYNAGVDYGIGISSENRLLIRNKDIATVANLKNWLGAHNTTVYYALATPTTTEITDQTLIDQLEALASATLNQGVNNIWIEIATGNAMPTLELNWVEWEKYNRHNVYIWNNDIDDWQVIVGAGA